MENLNPFQKLTGIDEKAADKLFEFGKLLREENAKVNLISRKDTDEVEYRHIALCAAIGEVLTPKNGAKVVDVGTGGGLPGIVLAIIWPQARITLLDGVGKKIRAVQEMIEKLGLKNARAENLRIEMQREGFDYIVGRAVCALPDFFRLVGGKIRSGQSGSLPNGVVYFDAGAPYEELENNKIYPTRSLDLCKFFGDELFAGKRISHYDKTSVLKLISHK